MMIAISPQLTLFTLAPFPLFVLATRYFSRALYRRSRAAQEALATLSERDYRAGLVEAVKIGITLHVK